MATTAVATPASEPSAVGARVRARRAAGPCEDSEQYELGQVASAELADLCGVVNAAFGRMVEVVADALDADACGGPGIHSPRQWLTWQTAMTDVMAGSILHLANRRSELSATVSAMVEGRLSLALAGLVGRYVPDDCEADALDLAGVLTVNQMRRSVTQFRFDVEKPDRAGPTASARPSDRPSEPPADQPTDRPSEPTSGAPASSGSGSAMADSDHSADPDAGPADAPSEDDRDASGHHHGNADSPPAPPAPAPGSGSGSERLHWFGRTRPHEERRDVSMGVDDDGHWYCTIRMPLDEGTLFETAVRNRREDLYRQAGAEVGPDAPRPRVSLADAVVSIAHSILESGAVATPSTDRYLIHAHLTAAPTGGNDLSHHLGAVLPDHLRHLHTCDGTIRPVLEREGTPCNVGRHERIVGRKLRRLIEHRDGGCTVPGCERRSGLEVHHIIHWEDGGCTDTDNLLTLCRSHHRAHHLGLLQIAGNADLPRHTAPGVCFADKWGKHLLPASRPTVLEPARSIIERAAELGLDPRGFEHPLGERMDPSAITFNRLAS